MRHCKNLLTPAQCLVRALELTVRPRARTGLLLTRYFSQAPFQLAVHQIPSTSRLRLPDKLATYTRDEQIKTIFVRVKRPDGSVGQEEMLTSILRRIDRRTETVVQLSKPGANTAAVVEVAKIGDLRKRVRDQEEEQRQKQLAQRERKPKQIELNWAISEHDLEMKLKQMEQFIAEGKKVEILLAGKKRARRASIEEAETVLNKIRARLVEIDAREVAPMDGVVLKQAILMVKSKKENATKTPSEDIDEGDSSEDGRLAARKAREEKREAARAKQEAERQLKEEEKQRLLKEFPDWNQPKPTTLPPKSPMRPGYY